MSVTVPLEKSEETLEVTVSDYFHTQIVPGGSYFPPQCMRACAHALFLHLAGVNLGYCKSWKQGATLTGESTKDFGPESWVSLTLSLFLHKTFQEDLGENTQKSLISKRGSRLAKIVSRAMVPTTNSLISYLAAWYGQASKYYWETLKDREEYTVVTKSASTHRSFSEFMEENPTLLGIKDLTSAALFYASEMPDRSEFFALATKALTRNGINLFVGKQSSPEIVQAPFLPDDPVCPTPPLTNPDHFKEVIQTPKLARFTGDVSTVFGEASDSIYLFETKGKRDVTFYDVLVQKVKEPTPFLASIVLKNATASIENKHFIETVLFPHLLTERSVIAMDHLEGFPRAIYTSMASSLILGTNPDVDTEFMKSFLTDGRTIWRSTDDGLVPVVDYFSLEEKVEPPSKDVVDPALPLSPILPVTVTLTPTDLKAIAFGTLGAKRALLSLLRYNSREDLVGLCELAPDQIRISGQDLKPLTLVVPQYREDAVCVTDPLEDLAEDFQTFYTFTVSGRDGDTREVTAKVVLLDDTEGDRYGGAPIITVLGYLEEKDGVMSYKTLLSPQKLQISESEILEMSRAPVGRHTVGRDCQVLHSLFTTDAFL